MSGGQAAAMEPRTDAFADAGAAPLAVPLAEVRDWLALAPGHEDASLAALVRTATEVAEGFTGLTLVARDVTEAVAVPADGRWAMLSRRPVRAILGVADAGGAAVDPAGFAIDIGIDGAGRVRCVPGSVFGGGTMMWRVTHRAGLVGEAGQLPAALRHGVLRLVQHLRTGGDGPGGTALVPSAVAALWMPYRRMRLV